MKVTSLAADLINISSLSGNEEAVFSFTKQWFEANNFDFSIQEDLFVAGPGFNAGRYGLGCGAATAAVTEQVKIPAVTALYAENPGTDLYKDRAYILQTENNAAKMREAMKSVAEFVDRLIKNDFIGDGRKEGYHGSGTDFSDS